MNRALKLRLLHLLFPNRCPVCGEVVGALDTFCPECRGRLTLYSRDFVPAAAAYFAAAFVYDDNVKPAVILLKKGVCANADRALGLPLAEKLRSIPEAAEVDIVVPVPMSRADVRRRGFNQAELIAKVVGEELGKPVVNALSKIRKTAPQKELDRLRRKTNLRGAFRAEEALVKGRNVLLVDDVCTTGATLSEAVSVLLKAGAESVGTAVCCKTVKK